MEAKKKGAGLILVLIITIFVVIAGLTHFGILPSFTDALCKMAADPGSIVIEGCNPKIVNGH
ncbi:hypothetical protein [Shewanella youngdeokensis]|uniref:Uncharacterized protein n=1 Tax=Shewanella youngdeokensis TaxID=2999068 RepID=A0ABZ0JTQ3_9GAMM|nr:hypothetical protein RGE70_09980 [Shewanella sp. DAU334]